MAKFFDKDGNEVEAFTQEELDAQKQAALDAYLKEHPDKAGELKTVQEKLTQAEKDLEDARKGNMTEEQKQRLIDAKKTAEEEVAKVKEELGGQINALKTSIFGGFKSRALKALAGDDKEKTEKIQAKYDSLMKTGDYPETEEGITKAMTEAATIINGKAPTPGFMDNMGNASGGGAGQDHSSRANADTANSVAIGNMLGVTDADREKYPPQGGTNNGNQ